MIVDNSVPGPCLDRHVMTTLHQQAHMPCPWVTWVMPKPRKVSKQPWSRGQ